MKYIKPLIEEEVIEIEPIMVNSNFEDVENEDVDNM